MRVGADGRVAGAERLGAAARSLARRPAAGAPPPRRINLIASPQPVAATARRGSPIASQSHDRDHAAAMRHAYMGALRCADMDEKNAGDGLDLPEGLSDEDREWIRRVVSMTEEEAEKERTEREKRTMIEESNRRDHEHFLTQIP